MKEDTTSMIFDLIAGIITIIIIGVIILLIPYQKAARRDSLEAVIIDDYLEDQRDQAISKEVPGNTTDAAATSAAVTKSNQNEQTNDSTGNARTYKGDIDSILVIDKINLQKAIIRGADNDYNLDRYLFVTADQTSVLGTDNYVIYGHCSQTYGHSFNRLDELAPGDTIRLIQGTVTYEYVVTGIQLELRENAAPLLDTGSNTVQLVSCEKKIAEGFSEKRLIIVTAEKATDDSLP